jgi:hypothetical protein
MKKIVMMAVIAANFISCRPGAVPNFLYAYRLDKTRFFSITFNGKTLNTYGLKSTVPPYLELSGMHAVMDTYTSAQVSSIHLNIQPMYATAVSNVISEPDGNVKAYIWGQRNGEKIGLYNRQDLPGNITDKTAGDLEYTIDNIGFNLNVTEISNGLVKGNFNCYLKSGNNRIPATGSFCVKQGN